jgi:hypothetical protein
MRIRLRKIYRFIFNRNSSYYSKNYYHDKSFAIYNSPESLTKLFDCSKKEVIETKTPIFLHKNIEFGSFPKKVRKKMGKASFKFVRTVSSLDFKILLYRMYLGGYKTKQEVHFYEDSLYYFNYIFSYLSTSDKENIKKLLCKKYLKQACELINKIIIDEYGNKLFITENVDFTINYLTGDINIPKEFNALREVDRINHQKLIEQNQEEFLNKL